jgi:uncharacterized protein
MTTIETPCIRICSVDPERDICTGCGRTVAEIAGWTTMAVGERRRIMALLPDRLRGGPRPPSPNV